MKQLFIISALVLICNFSIYAQCSNPNAGEDIVICGTTVQLQVSNATTGYWTAYFGGTLMIPSPVFSPNSTALSVSVTIGNYAGYYKDVVFVWTDDSGPCDDSVTVRFAIKPVSSVGPSNECEICGNCVTFDADLVGAEWAQQHYWTSPIAGEFTNPEGAESPDATFCADESAFGDTAYTRTPFLWNVNNNGCIASDTMYVIFYQPPATTYAGTDQIVCGNTAELGAVYDLIENPDYSPSGIWLIAQRPNPAATANFSPATSDTTQVTVSHYGVWKFVFRENNSLFTMCYTTDTVQVTFQPNNEILPVIPLIVDDEPVALIALVEGGVWAGNGIVDAENGIFDPSVAGIGMHTISYFIEDFTGCNGYTETGIHVTGVNLEGYLYNDENQNCIIDEGEGVPNTLVYANPGPYYAITDSTGRYRMYLDEGAYTLHANQSELFFVSCPETGFQNATITNINDTVQDVNIGLSHSIECPVLNTEVYSYFYRHCWPAIIYISYSNSGTVPAENAYIEVELNENINYDGSSLPYSSVTGNTYTFDINSIDVLDWGYFTIYADVECNTDLIGQTACVTSTIYSGNSCDNNTGNWDMSEIEVTGDCVDNLNACFNIINTAASGVGDMQNENNYRIFANDLLVFTGTFQLQGGESVEICWATNGSAIRLEADQHPEHPGTSHPQLTIEACGDENGSSYGYITTNSYDDEGQFIDTDCKVISGSYDPNEKEVYPSGITENNYIDGERALTYQVNFQNTGNDTAFTVVVVDTISPLLNMLTFERGICSHACELEVYGSGILVWTFNNILLPDSTTNEAESHGFVTYKIKPAEMTEEDYGTEILNNAAIYFDNNPPIITNTTRLTYWKLPLIYSSIGLPLKISFNIYPNPTTSTLKINADKYPAEVSIWDLNGRLVKSIEDYSGEELSVGEMSKGMYFVKLKNEDGASFGKLVVE